MGYNLSVLNDKEFEELSKDLLDIELGVNLQIFKGGKDKGIDLRYSYTKENEIIVQAKHYIGSSFNDLKTSLKKELTKIQNLTPTPLRYIVTTTVDLSPQNTSEILGMLSPYIKNTNDIYGKKRIEALLSNNPEVERKYFKLWLTSTNILSEILFNASKGRSDFYKEKILRRASLYVPTKNFNLAINKLNENKFIIISGEPGVGKTTLAYMLICDMLANGFLLINIDDQIKDAEELFSMDPDKKQIFFFDDFLGANINEILNKRNTESKIVNFIERIQSSKNKFLILTSRTTILNQANHNYEHFARGRYSAISRYEVKLSEYSLYDKGKILYNHLFHSSITKHFSDAFYIGKNYLKIIQHKNYFPRLIEFITTEHNYNDVEYKDFEEFIFRNLDNPNQIWKVAFEKQLDDEDRFLLVTLFSFAQKTVSNAMFESAFESRYEFEIKQSNISRKVNAYNSALKTLLDGFIVSVKDQRTGENFYSFINPSVVDFLLNYIKHNNDEKKRILYSIGYIEQLIGYFHPTRNDKILLTKPFLSSYYPIFKRQLNALGGSGKAGTALNVLYSLDEYFKDFISEDEPTFIYWMEILIASSGYLSSNRLSKLLFNIKTYGSINLVNLVTNSWEKLITYIIENALDMDDLSNMIKLFHEYNINVNVYLGRDGFRHDIRLKLSSLFEEYSNHEVLVNDDDILNTYSETDREYAKTYIDEKIWEAYISFVDECDLGDYYDYFEHEINTNSESILENVLSQYDYDDDYKNDNFYGERKDDDELSLIEDLFDR